MPANFGEIASYLNMEAARYQQLAMKASAEGDYSAAIYLGDLAVRHGEAALQQFEAMMPTQQQPIVNKQLVNKAPVQRPVALMAILHSAAHVAAALRKAIPRRSAPFTGLSLH